MPEKKKARQVDGRLGNFVLPDKKAVEENLTQFQKGVKSKEEVEAVADCYFETMRKLNLGFK